MIENKMKVYKEINIWQRKTNGTLCCFRCFELIPNGGFCVQSADLYTPNEGAEKDQYFKQQFIELLQDEAPEIRTKLFPSLQEAIQVHIAEFDEFLEEE
jgi:hypothetical protein